METTGRLLTKASGGIDKGLFGGIKENTLEWRETYPPVALSPEDPRYWPYKESTVAPSIVHNAVPPYGAVVIDDHIYAAREFDGKYWPVFKHWHGILERSVEEILILEKVA